MKLIYVAGPYSSFLPDGSLNIDGVRRNIRRAEDAASELWRRRWAVICPHANSGFMGGATPEKAFLEGDLEMLRRCDAVLMLEGWRDSKGSVAEEREAHRLGKVVFYRHTGPLADSWPVPEDMPRALKEHRESQVRLQHRPVSVPAWITTCDPAARPHHWESPLWGKPHVMRTQAATHRDAIARLMAAGRDLAAAEEGCSARNREVVVDVVVTRHRCDNCAFCNPKGFRESQKHTA